MLSMVHEMPDAPQSKDQLLQRANGLRRIGNIEIISCDIRVLIDGERKLGGLLIDAVGARLQQLAEDDGCLELAYGQYSFTLGRVVSLAGTTCRRDNT